jgi:methylated-DNA-[protein]-cysteine S-methyltransferase
MAPVREKSVPKSGAGREITPFQRRVYDALRRIPRGRVTTYGLLAKHLDCRSARAVGQALRRNPFAPGVPCHRVIASDLRIGGFTGHRSGPEIARKRSLLAAEGVLFLEDGLLADPGLRFDFDARGQQA